MINEIDYDQVGADTAGFVEIANTGSSAATLDGIALVLVNGGDGTEYARVALTGSLAAGGVPPGRHRGAERRAGRRRARSTRRRRRSSTRSRTKATITAATIDGQTYNLVEGTALAATVVDSNTVDGSLSRIPDKQDTNNAASDWVFTATKTPGAANVASP